MSTKRVNFRLPEELITQADVAAEVTHKNRTEILIEALRQYLEEKESDENFQEAVVELYLDGQIGFEKLADVIGRQDAGSVGASSRCLIRVWNSLRNSLSCEYCRRYERIHFARCR